MFRHPKVEEKLSQLDDKLPKYVNIDSKARSISYLRYPDEKESYIKGIEMKAIVE